MRKIISIVFIGFLIMQLSGCSTKSPSLITEDDEYMQVQEIFDKLVDKKEIAGIGVAPPNKGDDISLQESEAMAIARTRISNRIETQVGSFLKKYAEETGIKDNQKFVRDVKEPIINRTKNTIRGAKVIKRLRGKSGKIYILMALKTQELLNTLEDAKNDIKDKEMQIKYQRFLSDKNLEELEKELEKYDEY